jgi:hypothetical protein
MKRFHFAVVMFLLLSSVVSFAQKPDAAKVTVTGRVVDSESKQPLEYANIYAQNLKNKSVVSGAMTNDKGEFSFEVPAGNYYIKVEFLSFKTVEIPQKELTKDTSLGMITLALDAKQLQEVTVVAEKSTVEIKLDKKVYNVGKDMTVKGGSVSDVLDNVPSVTVDSDGNVSLRGNDNVRILIDGKPSGLAGINVADALRTLPADSVDKVEVITNPSARYDAEGGAGIVNIILKKGKAQGINGSVMAVAGNPDNFGGNTNVNFRSKAFNLFTNFGYNYSNSPGNSFTDSENLDRNTGAVSSYIEERRKNKRERKGYNAGFGLEWYLTKSLTWTNSIGVRKNNGANPDNVFFNNYDANHDFLYTRNRFNDQSNDSQNLEYSTNFTQKFKKDGHKLTVDFSASTNRDNDDATISDTRFDTGVATIDRTLNNQKQTRSLLQADYVLPIGKKSQFEAGYRGDFTDLTTDYRVDHFSNNTWMNDPNFTNIFEYKEQINALYAQFGSKISKFSYMVGMRFEDSNIGIDFLRTEQFNTKKYHNFFPSVFLSYEFAQDNSISLSYSKRINRPRGRFLNPFNGLSSNINVFEGNPDLNPSYTNSFDLGYLKRWDKLTLNTSAYFNKTDDSFQFIKKATGNVIDGNPVYANTPVNLATEYRFGFEFTLNYTPYKWWKLNGNFNFFRNELDGSYTYIDQNNTEVFTDLSNTAYSWFTRVSSKVSLPYGIDWQTNATYNAPQNTSQGRSEGIVSANLALSKDILKDKATIALNVNDVFNSRKRITDTSIPLLLNSHSEMQWRERQINLTFTYRFNKSKSDRDKQQKRDDNGGGDEYMGG